MSPRERDSSNRPRKTGARPSSTQARRADSDDAGAGADHAPTTNTPSEAVAAFLATQPFPLDPFQIEAAEHLAAGRSVLVAAPTGNGKTIVAEFAIWQARQAGQRAIYTAPIKALSNQKFRDLRKRHGVREVGLLTGDIVENPAAPIVVMTTEIYRNMLLEGARAARMTIAEEASALLDPVRARTARDSHDGHAIREASDVAEMARRAAIDEELSGVGCVIFDELHFLSDPERGPVWEEAIIHSPAHVLFAGLSATVSNADELRRWIEAVHGPMALVFHDERAVPLEHFFFFENKLHLVQNADGQRVERFPGIGGETRRARLMQRRRPPIGDTSQPYPRMVDILREGTRTGGAAQPGQPEMPEERPAPEPGEVVTALRAANMLPCLYFLPGRRAVEAAASSAAGHLLVTPEDRGRLHEQVQQWVRTLPPEDQKLDQVRRLATLLPRGLGFHHAGLLPALKVMVETFFARGDLKAVFATDTLALGINMPARTVVVGSLSKFDGHQMRLLTPNEYQQLTGRAGRRGMDAHGSAVLLYSPWDVFEPAFASLTAPLLPVTSAFTIRYNTILNLWRPGDYGRLRTAVANSLREFQRRGGRPARSRTDEEYALYQSQRRKKKAQRESGGLSRAASAELNATVYVLRMMGYIDEDDELTMRGWMLRAIFHPAGMVLTELALGGALDGLNPGELAEVVSWFTYDSSDRSLHNLYTLPRNLLEVRREVWKTLRTVQTLEYEEGVSISPGIVESFHSVALNWWRGGSLRGLLNRIELAEGDLLVVLNQTIDLLQQLLGQVLDSRALWQSRDSRDSRGASRRASRAQQEMRLRLEDLRELLAEAWRNMLRGSVALSRAIPTLAAPTEAPTETPTETPAEASELPPIPMAEDEDSGDAWGDRAEDASPADDDDNDDHDEANEEDADPTSEKPPKSE
jgi:superfamily II RNA helicase